MEGVMGIRSPVKKWRTASAHESSLLPHFAVTGEIFEEENDKFFKLRMPQSKHDFLRTPYKNKKGETLKPVKKDFFALTKNCISGMHSIRPCSVGSVMHSLSPNRKKRIYNDNRKSKNFRCSGLNFLIEACKEVSSEKDTYKNIVKEKEMVSSWKHQMNETSDMLNSINFCDSRIIKDIYSLRKASQQQILEDAQHLKQESEMQVFSRGSKTQRTKFN